MDIFLEQIIKKKKDSRDRLLTLLMILSAATVTVTLLLINMSGMEGLQLVLIGGSWYGAYLLIRRRRLEYEYCFTNGELDIDVIRARRKRYHAISVRAKEIAICANIFDDAHKERYLDASGIKRQYDMASTPDSRNVYFVDFRRNGERMRLLFEPTRKMLAAMKKYNPANIHIQEEAHYD